LLGMAQSGVDAGSASTMALQGLAASNEMAAGQLGGSTMGNLFSDLGNAYTYNQQLQGQRSVATPQTSQWYGVSSPSQTYSGSVSR
jgi:hypothetical protein